MGRELKQGLDYFYHNCDMGNDLKIQKLKFHYGMEGYGIYISLIEQLYQQENYILDFNDEDLLFILAGKLFTTIEKLNQIINKMVEIGLFNFEKWKQKILFSNGVYKRALIVENERERVRNSVQKYRKNAIKTDCNGLQPPKNTDCNDNVTECNDFVTHQVKKSKESKVNLSKEKESGSKGGVGETPTQIATLPDGEIHPSGLPVKNQKHKYGQFSNVLLTTDEFEKLTARTDGAEAIEFLSEYRERKGYKAKNDYLAICKWCFDAVVEERDKNKKTKRGDDYYDTE